MARSRVGSRQLLRRSLISESLESRQLLAADSWFDAGLVTVVADNNSNHIAVTANIAEDKLAIRVDEQLFVYRNHLVRHIHIQARGGNDVVQVAESVEQSMRIAGGEGNDSISGSKQADAISGGPGNDRLSGNGGADVIQGGAGNDHIMGGLGGDTILGGEGSDFLRGGPGNDMIYGDGPADLDEVEVVTEAEEIPLAEVIARTAELRTAAATATTTEPVMILPGESANDLILGDDGDDRVRSGPGHDVVFGGEGNDALAGGSGTDFIDGQAGNDRLYGGSETDILFGGLGNDGLDGGWGDDYLIGGSGHDSLDGGVGNDWLFGDATNSLPTGVTNATDYARLYADENRGNDRLAGGDGDDKLLGGNGNDRLSGDKGHDVMVGGAGADGINARDAQEDLVYADDLDTVIVDEFDTVTT